MEEIRQVLSDLNKYDDISIGLENIDEEEV